MRKSVLVQVVLVVLVLGVAGPVLAQSDNYLDRSSVGAGVFVATVNTSVSLNGENAGTSVDFENDLGLKGDTHQVWVDGKWRLTPRQSLVLGYTLLSRSNTRNIERELVIDDTTYDVGVTFDSGWDTQYVAVAYRFSLVRNDSFEGGVSGGISYFGQKLSLHAVGTITGPEGESLAEKDVSKNLKVPAPLVGLYALGRLSDTLYLGGSLLYIQATYDQYTGHVWDGRLSLDWFPWEHFGLGVGYLFSEEAVGVSKASFNGDLSYRFDGAQAYVRYAF
jgi:hypothetical protein